MSQDLLVLMTILLLEQLLDKYYLKPDNLKLQCQKINIIISNYKLDLMLLFTIRMK